MSETPIHREDEIDLFELLIKLWEGKWRIILAVIGAAILGMLYSNTLPSSYSGSTLVRAAQPSAFTRYTFLSETIRSMSETNRTAGTADFNYKIDDKLVFSAFISEFNDLEEVVQTLLSDENFSQQLSEVEESKKESFIISRTKQFEIVPPQKDETQTALRFTWGDIDDGKRIFETSLQLVLANVKATLAQDIDQIAQGVQSKLAIKIENAALQRDTIKEGLRLADKQRLLFLTEQATIARELGLAANFLGVNEQSITSGNNVLLSVQSSPLPFYLQATRP